MKNVNKVSLGILLGLLLIPASTAFGQQQAGNSGGFQNGPVGGLGGGFPGGPMMGGGMGGGQMAPISAVTAPLVTLTTELSLTSSQQSQVSGIQQQYRQIMQNIFQRSAQTAGAGPMGQMDAGSRAKTTDLANRSSAQIEMMLTTTQTAQLHALIGKLKLLQAAQISPQLYSTLNLTDDELSQISAIENAAHDILKSDASASVASGDFDEFAQSVQDSHREIHTKVVALLSASQSSLLQNNRFGHQGFGGQAMAQRGTFNAGGQGQTAGSGQDANSDDNGGGPGAPPDGGPGDPNGGGPGGPGNDGPGGPGGGN